MLTSVGSVTLLRAYLLFTVAVAAAASGNRSPTPPLASHPTNPPTFTTPRATPPTLVPTKKPSFPPTHPPTLPTTLASKPTLKTQVTAPPTLAPTKTPTPPPTSPPTNLPNNACDTALSIPTKATAITTFETASLSYPGVQFNDCYGFNETFPTKWFSYLTPLTCTVATASSSTHYGLVVYEGSCASSTCVTAINGNYQRSNAVSWKPTAGTPYLIAALAVPNSGDFELNVTCDFPTTNDSCNFALPTTTGVTTVETASLSSSFAPITFCNQNLEYLPTKWYTYTSPHSINVTASISSGLLVVFQGSCASSTCVTPIGGSDQVNNVVSWATTAGATYILAIIVNAYSGELELVIS